MEMLNIAPKHHDPNVLRNYYVEKERKNMLMVNW